VSDFNLDNETVSHGLPIPVPFGQVTFLHVEASTIALEIWSAICVSTEKAQETGGGLGDVNNGQVGLVWFGPIIPITARGSGQGPDAAISGISPVMLLVLK
jgi:hypothetical protein